MIFAKKIKSLEKLTLSLSGMCAAHEYVIVTHGEKSTVARYAHKFKNGDLERDPEGSVVLDTTEIIKALNKFGVNRWDGFYGKRRRGIMDGTDFSLFAAVNGGKEITARGSQNFPRGFHGLCSWFYEIMKKNGDRPNNERNDYGNT